MSTCRYVASDEPRVLTGRHEPGCADDECRGCQPCTEPHCRVCRRAHADQTCAECLAATRDDLHTIAAMCDALPFQAANAYRDGKYPSVDDEAMVLLAPAADPEAWGHLSASVCSGRLPADYIAAADSEQHPLFVLGTWEMVWRDHLEQPTQLRATIPRLVDYLDRQLHVMAAEELVPFEDFARDLRGCRGHLEAVLHDGEQRDTGAPCMRCGVPLERVWGADETRDGWRCPRCRERATEDQYRLAVAQLHREEATHLTDRDMEIRTGVKAGTVRSWANKGFVARRRDSERTVYAVDDVLRRVATRGREELAF